MRRSGPAGEMPQFVTHEEWVARRRGSVRKFATIAVVAALSIGCIAWVGSRAPSFMRGRSIAGVASWLRSAERLHIVARQPSDGSLVFEEWCNGSQYSLSRSSDGFRFVADANSVAAIGKSVAFYSDKSGLEDPRLMLADWIDSFPRWQAEQGVEEIGSKAIAGKQCRGLRLQGNSMRLILWVDTEKWEPAQIEKEFKAGPQWTSAWVANLSTNEQPPPDAFATTSVVEQTYFEKRAQTLTGSVKSTVGDATYPIAVRDFSVGRTGVAYLVIDIPKGVETDQWQVTADDSLNGAYFVSQLTAPLGESAARAGSIPAGSTLITLFPTARRQAWNPVSISVTLTIEKEGQLPWVASIEKRADRPDCDLAPDYLYARHSADKVNRRLLAAQDLVWGIHASRIQTSEGRQRSPDGRELMAMASNGLTDILRANAEYVSPILFDRMVKLTTDRIQHLNATGSIGYLGREQRLQEYEQLFPLASG